jgi:hypothetical protein
VGRKEKLLSRFLSRPKDFSYNELKSLLNGLGYSETRTGKSSGSRVAFIQEETKHIIRLHKPHPQKILKEYQIDYIVAELKNAGEIS